MIQYISFSKNYESCFVSLKNVEAFYEPLMRFNAMEMEKEFIVNGNKKICLEFNENEEISTLYLYMTKIFNHPTEVEIITKKTDHFYDTPFLIDTHFILLHIFYMILILVSLLTNIRKIPNYLSIPTYICMICLALSGYFLVKKKIDFQFFDGKLEYEIVESE
ncbi:hypothetical protein AB3N60_17620 [Leptospira sp. WS39.C2]